MTRNAIVTAALAACLMTGAVQAQDTWSFTTSNVCSDPAPLAAAMNFYREGRHAVETSVVADVVSIFAAPGECILDREGMINLVVDDYEPEEVAFAELPGGYLAGVYRYHAYMTPSAHGTSAYVLEIWQD